MNVSLCRIIQRLCAQAAQYECRSQGNNSWVTSEQGGTAVFQLFPNSSVLNTTAELLVSKSFINFPSKSPHRPRTLPCQSTHKGNMSMTGKSQGVWIHSDETNVDRDTISNRIILQTSRGRFQNVDSMVQAS